MYLFFQPDKDWPTSEEVAIHFQEIYLTYISEPTLPNIFLAQALIPFRDAMQKYRKDHQMIENPFVGGIFTNINGISIWQMLLSLRNLPNNRTLLFIMINWGFSDHDKHGWTYEDADKLYLEYEQDPYYREIAIEIDDAHV